MHIDDGAHRKREAAVEEFLQGETLDDTQKKEIAEEREKARADMENAVTKREDTVNPLLVELLKKHYGVDFDCNGKGTAKVGATRRAQTEYLADVERLYKWSQAQDEKKRQLAEEHEEEMQEKCPFAPSLSNKSRQIYSKEKDKIMEKRDKRRKEIEEKRLKKEKEERAKFRSDGMNKDAFSRRLVQKPNKKDDLLDNSGGENNENENKGQSLGLAMGKNGEFDKGPQPKNKKKPTNVNTADNFHKQMMEWCDKRDKNKTQKTVEHWVNTFENMENFKGLAGPNEGNKRRTKAEQVAHADTLIGTLEKKESTLEKQRQLQVKGLFHPKVSQYVPKGGRRRSKSKENLYNSIESQTVNVVYYSRSPQKAENTQREHSKSNFNSARKSQKDSMKKSSLNIIEVDEDRREKVERTFISARE